MFNEMKTGNIAVPGELYEKLKKNNFCLQYLGQEYLILLINANIVENIRTREVRPPPTPVLDEYGNPQTLLNFPIVFADPKNYYDEDIYQFYLSAQFEGYSILFVQSEEE
jgi:hypothetical protein